MTTSLSDLAAALAAATGPDRALDERLAVEVLGWRVIGREPWFGEAPGGGLYDLCPEYTASLDAITGALEQRWLGCVWIVENGNVYDEDMPHAEIQANDLPAVEGDATTAALSLCLAAVQLAMAEEGK